MAITSKISSKKRKKRLKHHDDESLLFEQNLKERIVDVTSGIAILFAVGFGSLLLVREGFTFIVFADYTVAILLSISLMLRYFWGGGSPNMQYFYGKLFPVVTIIVLFAMVYYRNIDESDAYWIYLVPPISIFVLGRRQGIIFSVVFLIWIVVANFIPDSDGHRTHELLIWMKAFWIYVSMVALCVIYESIRSRNHEQIHHILRKLSRANKELKKDAYVDHLTGIKNRRSFELSSGALWKHALHEKKQVSFMLIDVDHFHDFNDTHGHLEGDLALKIIGHLLNTHLHGMVGRLGGDEFGATFYDTDKQKAFTLAEKIRTAIEQHSIPSGAKAPISVSIGVSTQIPEAGKQISDLISAADINLYKAKESGRNRVVGD